MGNHEKTLEVGEDVEEDRDTEEVAAETKKDSNYGGSVDLIEGGKKDPLLRRRELLVDSGLAEVGG